MQAFLLSTGLVALAEMGDKTQLLALVLAARFRQPVAIGTGILVATLANHALAAWLGLLAGDLLDGPWFRLVLAAGFVALGLWALVPDKPDDVGAGRRRLGAFATTLICFFLAEMGDKTQVATVALAAQFQVMFAVVVGTTLGMMLANAPAVALGQLFAARLPLKMLRAGAAAAFIGIGAWLFFRLLFP
ncbi:TMEM165/GDT1 family protein [Desertibaculum subflavum]|uniref:TMEM165/GDT1 family protein n=1 Tax=Desertibaculum subflavum TaxID=2268458 RepID=UPI000E665FA3